jgi:hypothetical protein
MTRIRSTVLCAGLAFAVPSTGLAQVANPLPQALGMGGNYTALARGLGAPAWNPAGLGMPDSPRFSITALPMAWTSGIEPISFKDLADYRGRAIPYEARLEWLDRIAAAGGETGSFAGDVTYLALSVGPVAVSVSSSARARVDVAPDVAEVFFFGNAGLTGEPRDYDLEGSNVDVAGLTTFAASYAIPITITSNPRSEQRLAIGATLTYTVGNFLVMGQEDRSLLSSDPLSVVLAFPVVTTPMPQSGETFTASDLDNGTGVGLDVGAAWQAGILSAGAVIRNVFNTFDWDVSSLEFHRGIARWDADTAFTSFHESPIEEAPAAILDRLDGLYTFSPVLAVGAAVRVLPDLTIAGDVRHAIDDNLEVGEQTHVGVGAELSALPNVPLRAGLSLISGGYRLSAGLGLRLAGFQLSLASALRDTELGSDSEIGFALTFGVR